MDIEQSDEVLQTDIFYFFEINEKFNFCLQILGFVFEFYQNSCELNLKENLFFKVLNFPP